MATSRGNSSGYVPPRVPARRNGGGGNGGSGGGQRRRPKRSPLKQRLVLALQLFVLTVGFAIVCALGVVFYLYKNLPPAQDEIEKYKPLGRAMIYSSDGVVLANLFQQNREVITIDKIPTSVQNATVAIEDRRFYSNVGIDFRGIGRALYRDATHHRSKEGASTITQQLVRNMGIGGVGREKTIARKIKEALYAIQIEQNYSKQQILEMYLNQVYYGSGAYGIQSAAETYFNKPAEQLTLPESALLAGLPKAPTDNSPYTDPDAARRRRNLVLSAMLDERLINDDDYNKAKDTPITLGFKKSPQGKSQIFHAPYFVDFVKKEIAKEQGDDFLFRGGLKVYTTLNWAMQDQAEKALQNGVGDGHRGATQAALVAMDPNTGFIKAMVGGRDYTKSEFNIAADGHRQPGSSFKPIIYTSAIDSGLITENTRILDAPVSFPGATGAWAPKNDDNRYHGMVTAKRAMADSINVPAVKVLQKVGVSTAIRYARIMGVKSDLQPYLTLALGASAVTPLEMACVYSVIDNGGKRPTPRCIARITDDHDNDISNPDVKLETTPISVDALSQVSDMLRAVVTQGTAYGVLADGAVPDAHGKTGTTQSHRDVWFDGYTKDLVCIVWAGHPSEDGHGHPVYLPMMGNAFGATICAPIWKRFMVTALPIMAKEKAKLKAEAAAHAPPPMPPPVETDTPDSQNDETTNPDTSIVEPTPAPGPTPPDANQVTVWIDNNSGERVPDNSPNAHGETFAKGTEPLLSGASAPTGATTGAASATSAGTSSATSHRKTVTVSVCTDSGLLATQWCPSTIKRTFTAGNEPKQYCDIHTPPDGER